VCLGKVPQDTKFVGLVLNLGERLLGTVLQAFPESMLPEYLPREVGVRQPHRELMVGRAMGQGHVYDEKRDTENR
jgi:hypothetical protein